MRQVARARTDPPSAPGRGASPYDMAREYLERQALQAQANGDTAGLLELNGAIGAVSALETGNDSLINLYGGQAVATARLAILRFQ